METGNDPHLRLGDEINGTVVKPIGGRRFSVTSNQVPRGWKVELQSRRPEDVEIGGHTTFWIAKITPLKGKVLVHEGDFGRLPISDALKPRYLEALRALAGRTAPTGDNLADARSMVARIETKDQADWLSVWTLLGSPASGDAKELIHAVEDIRAARKNMPDALPEMLNALHERFGSDINRAIIRLTPKAPSA